MGSKISRLCGGSSQPSAPEEHELPSMPVPSQSTRPHATSRPQASGSPADFQSRLSQAGPSGTSGSQAVQGQSAPAPKPQTTYPTSRPSVEIATKPGDSPRFPSQVQAQLDQLASKPNGNEILNRLDSAKAAHPDWPSSLKIVPQKSQVITQSDGSKTREYLLPNQTQSFSDLNASNGTGTRSALFYNPKMTSTPDGDRPPFVGLGHEATHAMHNAEGTSTLTSGQAGKKADEYRTTGIGRFEGESLSENGIRSEHGLPRRDTYSGLESSRSSSSAAEQLGANEQDA